MRLHLIDARLDFMSVGDTDFSPPATAVKLVFGVFIPPAYRGGGILAYFVKMCNLFFKGT